MRGPVTVQDIQGHRKDSVASLTTKKYGARGVAQCLGVLPAPPEDVNLVSYTHIRLFTATHSPAPRDLPASSFYIFTQTHSKSHNKGADKIKGHN